MNIPLHCQLADPLFLEVGAIDILLGAEIFFDILKPEKIKLENGLCLYASDFGYLIGGRVTLKQPKQISCVAISDLHDQLKKFWEIESYSSNEMGFSIEEKAVENHYLANVDRLTDGRYQLALPFNDKVAKLGESLSQTRRIYSATERRLNRNPEKKSHYNDFMNEMVDLGHMELAPDTDEPHFFMTHHLIERPSSSTTKYRVVFYGSKKSRTGISLN